MELHARLSPSNKRWPVCPGSVEQEKQYPDVAGDAAIDGTGSHILLELALLTRDPHIEASRWIGHTIGAGHHDKPEGWVVNAERAARVQIALNYLKNRLDDAAGFSLETESKSDPGAIFGRTDWWGTCDVTLTSMNAGILEIIDYKDGFEYVEEKDNSQLISYAAGKVAKWVPEGIHISLFNTFHTIRMTIIQPKIQTKPIRFVETNWQKLWPEVEKLAGAAALTDCCADLVAGDHCRWCKHSDNCSARAALAGEGLALMAGGSGGSVIEAMQSGEVVVADMSVDQLAQILNAEPVINAMIAKVREEAISRIGDGQAVPGYAMGKGKGSNVWNSDQEMVEKKLKGMRFLTKDLYPAKFVSPAQALKKEGLTERQAERIQKELIVYVAGKQTLIKSNMDQPSAEQMFSGVGQVEQAPAPPVETTPEPENLDTLSFM